MQACLQSIPLAHSPDVVDGLLYRHLLAGDQVGEHESGGAAEEE